MTTPVDGTTVEWWSVIASLPHSARVTHMKAQWHDHCAWADHPFSKEWQDGRGGADFDHQWAVYEFVSGRWRATGRNVTQTQEELERLVWDGEYGGKGFRTELEALSGLVQAVQQLRASLTRDLAVAAKLEDHLAWRVADLEKSIEALSS